MQAVRQADRQTVRQAGRQADMAGALSRIIKGLALLPVLARQTWQAF